MTTGDQGDTMSTDDTTPPDTVTDTVPDTEKDTPPGGPTLTLARAVEVSGVARSTLQRRLREGAIPGATRTDTGGWSIPYAGLLAAGMIDTDTTPKVDPVAELARVTGELADERARRITAEVLAAERLDRINEAQRNLEDLRAALADTRRQLPPAPGEPTTAPAPRARWWRR